jgi:hypothetical protein
MSLQRQKQLIEELSNLGENIPGLDVDIIIENIAKNSDEIKSQVQMIEEEVDENIERGMDENQAKEEGKQKIKDIIKKYKESIRDAIIEQITIIKLQFKVFKEGLAQIPADVKATIANLALPPAITVPPGGPNPIYAVNLASTTKRALIATLSVMIIAFTAMLIASNKIFFVLPNTILSLFEKISTFSKLLNTIPV